MRPEAYAQVSDAPDPFDQPSPDLAWLCRPGLTGMPAQERDALITTLTALHETSGKDSRPSGAGTGPGSWPLFSNQRLGLPQGAVARLFSVTPFTINRRIRDIRQLLDTAGHTVQPTDQHLATLDDLYSLASTAGITIPAEIKTAS